MSGGVPPLGRSVVLNKPDLGAIIARLWQAGYTVIGPTIAQGAIIFDEVRRLDQLPIGWTDEQEGGTYRLRRREDGVYFGYAVGPHSWKKYLFPPRLPLFTLERTADGFQVQPPPPRARDRRPATLSWAPAPAICTPSRSRIAPSSTALSSIPTTGRVGKAPSSSPSTVPPRHGPVFAPACRPAPGPNAASTWP
jgi:hypothetical protein